MTTPKTPLEEKEIRGVNLNTLRTYFVGIIIIVGTVLGSFYGVINGQSKLEYSMNELRIEVQSSNKINGVQLDVLRADIKRIDLQIKEIDERLNKHLQGDR